MQLPSFLKDLTIPLLDYHGLMRDWYREMRMNSPVFYDEENQVWMVLRYEDGLRVRSEHALFSSEETVGNANFPTIISMDPPRHTKMRSLVTQALSARTIASMAPDIQAIVNKLLDRAAPNGKMDWVTDLAQPLPILVIANMLGLPFEGWPEYRDWTDCIVNQRPGWRPTVQRFWQVFEQAIEEHQQSPRQDILSLLIAAEVDGERLNFMELVGFCFTLFVAGHITTVNLLGSTMLCLLTYPDTLGLLQQRNELVATMTEEIIRYIPPLRGICGDAKVVEGRAAKADVTLGGQLIRAGEHVKVDHFSINFDEQIFTNPDAFDITRSPNRHQSFGHGIHFCLGAPLARMEIKIVLDEILKRMQNIQLASQEPLQQCDSHLFLGPRQLPILFRQA